MEFPLRNKERVIKMEIHIALIARQCKYVEFNRIRKSIRGGQIKISSPLPASSCIFIAQVVLLSFFVPEIGGVITQDMI